MRCLLPVLTCLAAACGGGPTVVGKITDESGAPVERAEVRTDPPTDHVLSNRGGIFVLRQSVTEGGAIAALSAGAYTVVVTKPGYEEARVPVTLADTEARLDVQLVPRVAQVTPTAPTVTPADTNVHQRTSTPINFQ